jgi:hypothetical protein
MISYIEKRLGDAHARLKRGVPLAANQVNYSLIYRTPELNGVKAACEDVSITMIAYSPISQGRIQSLNFLPNYPIVLNMFSFLNLISCTNLYRYTGVLTRKCTPENPPTGPRANTYTPEFLTKVRFL